VGTPPFCTSSILHLVRLIRHEAVKWPDFISPVCQSFIQVSDSLFCALDSWLICMYEYFIFNNSFTFYCFFFNRVYFRRIQDSD